MKYFGSCNQCGHLFEVKTKPESAIDGLCPCCGVVDSELFQATEKAFEAGYERAKKRLSAKGLEPLNGDVREEVYYSPDCEKIMICGKTYTVDFSEKI